MSPVTTPASFFTGIGVILIATALWYPLLMEVLFRFGVGYKRRGQTRRIRMTEWLNASGAGLFLGALLLALGRSS